MPRYFINGKAIYSDKELSSSELDELASDNTEAGFFSNIYSKAKELGSKANEFMNTPLLPDKTPAKRVETYIGADTPIIKNIWPGGIRVPNMSDIYQEVVRPMSAPLGIAAEALGAGIAARGRYSHVPTEAPTEDIPLPKSEPLGLPPAPSEPTFVGGPSGGSGQVVSAEEAAVAPSKYYKVIGRGQTPDAAKGADLAAIKEAERLKNLDYGAPEQYPGQYAKIPNQGMQLPLESGDVTGGFQPETSSEMEYPYNVIPNQLRPRYAQTQVLGQTGIKGMDLSTPENIDIEHEFTSGGPEVTNPEEPDINQSTPGGYYSVGQKPAELPSALPRELPKDPVEELHIASEQAHPNGDAPPIDTVAKAIVPDNLPTPGAPKDINNITAYTGSADQVLETREATKPIVDLVRNKGWDKMQSAIGTWIRKLDDITSGMSKEQRVAFGKSAEGLDVPEAASIPDLDNKLINYRSLMDDIFKTAKVARGGKLGYIEDYVTHVQKAPEDFASGLKDLFSYRQGKAALKGLFERKPLTGEGTSEAAGIYGKGMGEIAESPFAKTRGTGIENLDYDVNKLGRMYIESMARESYLRPAIQQAEGIVKGLPDSKLKELAEWYIKNVTRFDSAPNLHKANQQFARFMIDTTGKSMMGFNPHLQALHLMRLGPVWAELGTKYSAQGLIDLLKNPKAAYEEAASVGLLPQELYPPKFQTANERANSILNFKSMIDFIDRSIAYKGFLRKHSDAGLTGDALQEAAINDAKRSTFTTDPSRATMGLNPDYSMMGTAGRLIAQYKSVPAKVVEWTARTAAGYKQNPAAATRALALLGTAGASGAIGGPELFHMPTSLGNWSAASLNEVKKILTSVYKGNPEDAIKELALWMTPAGLSIERQFQ